MKVIIIIAFIDQDKTNTHIYKEGWTIDKCEEWQEVCLSVVKYISQMSVYIPALYTGHILVSNTLGVLVHVMILLQTDSYLIFFLLLVNLDLFKCVIIGMESSLAIYMVFCQKGFLAVLIQTLKHFYHTTKNTILLC